MKVLIINGPNLNMLGKREPGIYGTATYEDLVKNLKEAAGGKGIEVEFFQSNIEGEIVTSIQKCMGNEQIKGIVINAGAYAHYSIAIRDAIAMLDKPVISVHISNITERESFRHEDVIAPVCKGLVTGLGFKGYEYALWYIADC